MSRVVFAFGILAGLVVALPMMAIMILLSPATFMAGGVVYGFATMILALVAVFLGIKHYRDRALGGVIRFGTAFLVGLGISTVASVIYALGWEVSLAASGLDFAEVYNKSLLEAARARGAADDELRTIAEKGADFAIMYSNPLYRVPLSFIEMFPVGVVISLISAALLRNSRLLPARQAGVS